MVFPKPGLLLLVVPLAQALDNGVGLTPPMGFNDYQTGLGVADLEAVADAFESLGLRAAGYAFINSDAGWQSGRNATSGAPTPNMASLAAALNTRGFGLGLYSALSSVQCGGDPGGLYHEAVSGGLRGVERRQARGNGGDGVSTLLWAVAKAPLLLSVNVSTLSPRLLALAKNAKILAVNQDALGVQGRKVAVDGAATLLDVGVEPCAAPDAFGDDPASVAEVAASKQTFDVVPSGGASLLRAASPAAASRSPRPCPSPTRRRGRRSRRGPPASRRARAVRRGRRGAALDLLDARGRRLTAARAAASLFSLATNGSLLTLLPETDAARAVNHVGGGPPAYGAAGAAEPCESPRVPRPMPGPGAAASPRSTPRTWRARRRATRRPGPGLAGGAFAVVLHNRRGPDNATAALPLALLNETRRFWSYASLPSFRRLGYASRVPPMPAAAAAYVASDLETGEVLGPLRLAESLAAPVAKGGARVFRLAPQ
ncbi:alpha-galactosidase [Aureococcus anophagefferens]|nr:alpha-galactosidase [Aureococcus anophagefferens]